MDSPSFFIHMYPFLTYGQPIDIPSVLSEYRSHPHLHFGDAYTTSPTAQADLFVRPFATGNILVVT